MYTIMPKDDDLQEPIGTPKFVKASNWTSTSTSKSTETEDTSRMPDSRTSSQNTLGISEDTLGLNFLSLNEGKNLWIPSITGKLISPPGIPNTELKTPKRKDIEDLLNKPLSNIYRRTSNLRFGPDVENNPFRQPTNNQVPILPTFSTWESTNNVYYYNLLKNKGPAKRKVTFGQTITQ